MKIYIDNEKNLENVQEHISTIFDAVAELNNGKDFTMYSSSRLYCDNKNNHIYVNCSGDDNLANKVYSIIKQRIAKLLPDMFDLTTMSYIHQYRIE